MDPQLLSLYPLPGTECPLRGAYLAHRLHAADQPFIYTNFIASLDGRISEVDRASGRRGVPRAIANERDWRLFLELAAQADVLLTTSRHLRAMAAGRHGTDLDFTPHPDLLSWRRDHGLTPQPPLVAVSEGLDIPVAEIRQRYPGEVLAATSAGAPAQRIRRLERAGVEVIAVEAETALDGRALRAALEQRGWSTIYSIAGPRVAHALFSAGAIDRLYLTMAATVLGGDLFDTVTFGPVLKPARQFSLSRLYYDRPGPRHPGQLFAAFDNRDGERPAPGGTS